MMPTRNQKIIYNIFINMRQQAATVYEHPNGLAVALYNPGKPVWLWAHENMTEADIRSFFYAFIKAYPAPLMGLVTSQCIAQIGADIIGRDFNTKEITAYYLSDSNIRYKATGFLRAAVSEDLVYLGEWINQFYSEALDLSCNPESVYDNEQGNETDINAGSLYILEDGEPCAMGMLCKPAHGFCRINLIYVPKYLRGRGYGKTVVYTLSKAALKKENLPFLFTDAGNKKTNALYRSLGFKETGRLTELIFMR